MKGLTSSFLFSFFFANKTAPIMEGVNYMNSFVVRIIEDDANTYIYTDVSTIGIDNDKIMIDREDGDERNIHQLDRADEIIIKANR